jgi:membrane protein YqaA with SNARE-associated domain
MRFAALTTVASVAGGIFGYAIGAGAWHALGGWFFAYVPGVTPQAFERVQALYDRWDFWAVFMAGLTPIPYKVFTLSAGVFSVNFPVFVAASVLSRGLRFFLVAGLIYRFGAPVRSFIDRYFNLLTLVFGILLVGGFLVVKTLL